MLGPPSPQVRPPLKAGGALTAPSEHRQAMPDAPDPLPGEVTGGPVEGDRDGGEAVAGDVPGRLSEAVLLQSVAAIGGHDPVDDTDVMELVAPALGERAAMVQPLLHWCQLCRCYQVSASRHLQEGADAPTGRQGTLTLKPLTASPLFGLAMGSRGEPAFRKSRHG